VIGAQARAVPIAVVDYGAGNLVSVACALERVGARVALARHPRDLSAAAGIVVPGVGASRPAMARLRRAGMEAALGSRAASGTAILGICLGMELMFERSDEDGAAGLGWLPGAVRIVPDAPRLPHIGWNQVELAGPAPNLFARVESGTAFYFVHSYAPVPEDPRIVAATSTHGGRFASAVASGRLFGVQFHPEKSGAAGLRLLANFVALAA
jgi:imidazole glycerol-phosphate synthase subunit HisH